MRDPGRYADLARAGVTLSAGDVTRAGSVAAVAAGHDTAISAVYRADVAAEELYVSAARALLGGLPRAGVGRLLVVGIGTTLETEPGVRVMDAPGFPEQARELSAGHAAALDVLRAADTPLDWLVLAPPPTILDNDAARTGRYRIGGDRVLPAEQGGAPFPYADLAVALVDEIENPAHHRALVAVAPVP
jgi:uncharacterized protein